MPLDFCLPRHHNIRLIVQSSIFRDSGAKITPARIDMCHGLGSFPCSALTEFVHWASRPSCRLPKSGTAKECWGNSEDEGLHIGCTRRHKSQANFYV
jgi:hypothetical protein